MLGSCGASDSERSEPASHQEHVVRLTADQRAKAGIEIGTAERRTLRTILRVSGVVDVPPRSLVSVSFPLGGYLKETQLLPGMPVRKGQVLAILEDPQYIQLQQEYLVTSARLEYAKAELERQQALLQGQASSMKAYQEALREYRALAVQQKALSETLRLIGIDPERLSETTLSRTVAVRSPIDGFVSAVYANIGKYVAPRDVLFELVNPKDIHLSLKVFEKDVPLLRIGQRVRAYPPEHPDTVLEGRIILISRNLDSNRTVTVHCHFDTPTPRVLPGMYLRAEVEVEVRDAVAVPESAVVRWDNRHFVFLERGAGTFEMVEVDVGAASDGYVQVSPRRNDVDLLRARLVRTNAFTLLMKLKNTSLE